MSADCDVLIVGSGPVGTAIARELADLEAGLQVLVLEAGRVLGDTTGGHVKNIADTEARDRLLAELATGPGPLPGGTPARPGTVLVGAEAMPNAAMSTNVGGMGAHWTAACPRPVDDEVPDCLDPAVLDEALSRAVERAVGGVRDPGDPGHRHDRAAAGGRRGGGGQLHVHGGVGRDVLLVEDGRRHDLRVLGQVPADRLGPDA